MKKSRSFILIAEEYLKAGMADKAISILEDGLKLYPNYIGARVLLARTYMEQGLVDEALREFEKVVEVSPDNIFAHKRLVDLYRKMGRINDAIHSCRTILEFNPKDKEASAILSDLLAEKEKSERPVASQKEAETSSHIDFTSSWEITPPEDAQYMEEEFLTETMADLYISQGNINKGKEIYKKLLENDPSNESVKRKLQKLENGSHRDRQIARLETFLGKIRKNRR